MDSIQNNNVAAENSKTEKSKISTPKYPRKYYIFMIVYFGLYEIFDSYTTTFYPMVVSLITRDLNITISQYYVALGTASLGLYAVLLVQLLCDLVGRKPMVIFVFLGMGVSTYFLSRAATLAEFTVALFFMFVFFSSDLWVIMISEEVPKEKRAKYNYYVMLIGVIGVLMITVMRGLLTNESDPSSWRKMCYFAYAAIPLSFLGLMLKETEIFRHRGSSEEFKKRWTVESLKTRILMPFKGSNREPLIGFIMIGFVIGINYTTLQTIEKFLTNSLQNYEIVNYIILIGGLGSILVYAITGYLADKFGRKKTMILYTGILMLSIIFLVVSALNQIVWLVFIFTIFVQMGYWGNYSLSKLYCVESFPSNIRGNAAGWRSFSYALGITVGSFISAGLVNTVSLGWSYVINGLWIAVVIPLAVFLLIPETKDYESLFTGVNPDISD